jgi:hypothetical protein
VEGPDWPELGCRDETGLLQLLRGRELSAGSRAFERRCELTELRGFLGVPILGGSLSCLTKSARNSREYLAELSWVLLLHLRKFI